MIGNVIQLSKKAQRRNATLVHVQNICSYNNTQRV